MPQTRIVIWTDHRKWDFRSDSFVTSWSFMTSQWWFVYKVLWFTYCNRVMIGWQIPPNWLTLCIGNTGTQDHSPDKGLPSRDSPALVRCALLSFGEEHARILWLLSRFSGCTKRFLPWTDRERKNVASGMAREDFIWPMLPAFGAFDLTLTTILFFLYKQSCCF